MADQASANQGQAPTQSAAERLAAGLAAEGGNADQQGQAPAATTDQASTSSQSDTAQGRQQQDDQGQDSWLSSLPQQAQDEIRRLRQGEAQYRTRLRSTEQERDQLRQANETEQERIKRERDEAVADRDRLRLENLRGRVILAKELPAEAANFLTGSTQEELEQNADKLKAMLGNGAAASRPDFGAGARPSGGDGDDMNAILRRASGRVA